MGNLTAEEKKAVAALKRLAKAWPKSLWLCSQNGSLFVAKKAGGRRVMTGNGEFATEAFVAPINIENDACA